MCAVAEPGGFAFVTPADGIAGDGLHGAGAVEDDGDFGEGRGCGGLPGLPGRGGFGRLSWWNEGLKAPGAQPWPGLRAELDLRKMQRKDRASCQVFASGVNMADGVDFSLARERAEVSPGCAVNGVKQADDLGSRDVGMWMIHGRGDEARRE